MEESKPESQVLPEWDFPFPKPSSVLPASTWPWNATQWMDVLAVNIYLLHSTFTQAPEVLTGETPANHSLFLPRS